MRIAVLSLCRDRLAYTQHCFQRLRELAGCDYEHFVLDQGSTDGTREWLETQDVNATFLHENVGVSRGINLLLDEALNPADYDVIVKLDNDCELTVPDTLKACCEVAVRACYVASPHIQGLDHPPTVEREETVEGYRVGVPNIMGGIFMAAPASLYQSYRHDETNPVWGLDDAKIVDHWRSHGGEVGYLLDYPANHYRTTRGQHEDFAGYFARRVGEGGPP